MTSNTHFHHTTTRNTPITFNLQVDKARKLPCYCRVLAITDIPRSRLPTDLAQAVVLIFSILWHLPIDPYRFSQKPNRDSKRLKTIADLNLVSIHSDSLVPTYWRNYGSIHYLWNTCKYCSIPAGAHIIDISEHGMMPSSYNCGM